MYQTTAKLTILLLLSIPAIGCAGGAGKGPAADPVSAGDAVPVADRDMGLSRAGVFDTPEPPAVAFDASDPGERPAVEPVFPGAPPLIPHGVADFLPITADSNPCVDCHAVERKIEGEPTPIPSSHYTDLRNAPERTGDEVVGARYVCTACHASQSAAAPLVPNRFGGR